MYTPSGDDRRVNRVMSQIPFRNKRIALSAHSNDFDKLHLSETHCLLEQFPALVQCERMCIASIPLKVRLAVLKDLNSIIGFTIRLMSRCSFTITLFKYFTCHNSVVATRVSSAFKVSIATE